MSFPRYPTYKPSSVEWLGEVPEHWRTIPLKHVAEFINGAAFKPEEWSESGMPIVRIQNLNGSEDFNYFDGGVDDRYLVHEEDLLFGWSGNRGTSFGPFIWHRKEVCALNQHIFRVVARDIEKRELYWILKAVTAHVEDQAHGIIGMVHITKSDLGAISVPIPEESEQAKIASFLDRETTKIDALIAEQQRLIELLQEKRQAVISHAVTKGLNPNAPMKDSGVEWLGEVPEHWVVKPIRHTHAKRSGGTPSKSEERYWLDGTIPWASSKDLKKEVIHDTLDHITEAAVFESGAELQPVEAVFVCVRGMILAHTFPVTMPRVPMAINQDLKALIPCSGISANYLAILLRGAAKEILARVDEAAHGTKVLRMNDFNSMPVAIPPPEEQEQISRFVEEEFDNIAKLVERSSKGIDLLQERRSALISAAVTGQIDVRGLVEAEGSEQ
jgi:type I restriction enzyme S subunit